MARNSTQSLQSMNSRGDIKTNLLMQLEENKEHLYIQDNQIERMNQKIKEIIDVNLNETGYNKIENENLSNY